MKGIFKNFVIFLILFIILAVIFSTYNASTKKIETIDISTLVNEINDSQISEIAINGNKLNIIKADGSQQTSEKESTQSFSELMANYQVDPGKFKAIKITINEGGGWSYWLGNILPFLLPLVLIAGFVYIMLKQIQGANSKAMSFGQSSAREVKNDGKNKITFKDVAGCKEAKEELQEVVEFLKNPTKFTNLGAKIPRGVLLMGAPGTGKTLMAKAVAGEAGVPFFTISGSEFVEMFVGVGASRVRDLFKRAKKSAPCIIFIDEIDAVGRQRGAGLGGSHDEREQTLNQILVEMDGMETKVNVIVMAATNRPDILDPALLRPGRFDRRVTIDMPDIVAREEILTVHAADKPMAADVSLRKVAERTPGFSGADLSNLLNEAAILAARQNRKKISMNDVLISIEKVLLGPERKSHIMSEKEKKITAYHEAGHALCGHFLTHTDPIQKVSVISRGQAAGYTLQMPIEDRHLHSKSEFLDDLVVLLGGRAAEKLIFNEMTTGASSDLEKATSLARDVITRYGMDEELGPRTFGQNEEMIFLGKSIHEQRDYSEAIAEKIDNEISKLIHDANKKAKELLSEHKDLLDKVTEALLAKETLEREEFEKIVGPKK